MTEPKASYEAIGATIAGAVSSQMFGKPCFKIDGKAFCSFYLGCMVFKLRAPEHALALALDGAELFDPSGKGRAMKEWVQVPHSHHTKWQEFANSACEYVQSIAK